MQSSQNISDPVCIITGLTGAGKTTLLNAICGTDHKAGRAQGSVTKTLYQNRTNVGNHSFDIMDTPGIDSREETYQHAYLLFHALTVSPLNTIFVILQYNNRFDKLIENYMKSEIGLPNYKDNIVVMISHWDQSSQQKEEEKKEIIKIFKEVCDQDRIIFYSSIQDSASCIADKMYNEMCKMPKKQLEISEEEFLLTFNIYETKIKMFRSQQQCFNELNILDGIFRTLASEAPQIPEERDDFLHSLLVAFKVEIESLQDEFLKKYKQEMVQIEYYCLWICLSKKCLQISKAFSDFIYPKMSYSLNDSQDPRNLIKKCPNCGEIWFKIEGCDGQTTCGNVASKFYDTLTKPWTKFKFVRNKEGKFEWNKISMNTISKSNEQVKSASNSKKKGCGLPFVWKDQAKLDESLILELFQVKKIEEIKAILNNKDFKKTRDELDANIDRKVYS